MPAPFRRKLLPACLCLLASAPLLAEELTLEEQSLLAASYGDKASFSLATGSLSSLRRAPAVGTVITAEDIAAMGATDLDEVLETVPGLHVARASLVNQPIYIMRGLYSQPTNPQILMLQNGVPVTTLFTGDKGNAWGGLPLEHVSRIEIVRGPGSALYGADAYAGVINIVTKSAGEIGGTRVGARAGSFDGRDVWLQHGSRHGGLDVAGYLRRGHSDGQREVVEQDLQTTRDRAAGTQASRAPGPVNTAVDAVDGALELGLGAWRLRTGVKLRDHLGVYVGAASALDPDSYSKSLRTTADLGWADHSLRPDLGAGFSLSYQGYTDQNPIDLMIAPPGTRLPGTAIRFPDGWVGGPGRWERTWRVAGWIDYAGLPGHKLRLGSGWDDLDLYKSTTHKNFILETRTVLPSVQEFDNDNPYTHIAPVQRTNRYVYLQDEYTLTTDWYLTAGLRHDRYSDFGNTTNPRAALVWDSSLNLTTKLLWGRAYRAPAFIEAYGVNPANAGNPDIKPERISTRELAFNWQAHRDVQLSLNVFRYDADDQVRVVAAKWQNTGSQRGRGAELEATWDPSHLLRLTAQGSWQRSVDQASGLDAGYAPHSHYFARADWRLSSGWQVGLQGNRVLNRKRGFTFSPTGAVLIDTRDPLPDYNSVDLTMRFHTLLRQFELTGSVRNLFDARIIEPSLPGTLPTDLPQAGRTWYLQGDYKF